MYLFLFQDHFAKTNLVFVVLEHVYNRLRHHFTLVTAVLFQAHLAKLLEILSNVNPVSSDRTTYSL